MILLIIFDAMMMEQIIRQRPSTLGLKKLGSYLWNTPCLIEGPYGKFSVFPEFLIHHPFVETSRLPPTSVVLLDTYIEFNGRAYIQQGGAYCLGLYL